MRSILMALALFPLAMIVEGCAKGPTLDALAGSYVTLVLAVGRHDALYVDAFDGPPAWKSDAERGAPVTLPALIERVRA